MARGHGPTSEIPMRDVVLWAEQHSHVAEVEVNTVRDGVLKAIDKIDFGGG